MKCVSCKAPMIVLELDQIEVDYCLDCGGTWLDSGELELLLEHPDEVKKLLNQPALSGAAQQGDKKCPICRKGMNVITLGSEKPVSIDLCGQEHGIWFDRGELMDIVGLLGGGSNAKVADLLQDIFGEKKNQT